MTRPSHPDCTKGSDQAPPDRCRHKAKTGWQASIRRRSRKRSAMAQKTPSGTSFAKQDIATYPYAAGGGEQQAALRIGPVDAIHRHRFGLWMHFGAHHPSILLA